MYEYLNKKSNDKTLKAFLFVFLCVVILRSHTLINDYYDRDSLGGIISATKYLNSKISLEAYYGIAYRLVYQISIALFGPFSYIGIHISAIIIIFLTSIVIYYTSLKLANRKAAFYSALLYAIFSSCSTKDYLALCSEFVFNLYLSLAFFFLVLAEFTDCRKKITKRTACLILSVSAYIIAANIKAHAVFFVFVYFLYFFITLKISLKRKIAILAALALIFFLSLIIPSKLSAILLHKIKSFVTLALSYILSTSDSSSTIGIKVFAAVLAHLSIQLTLFYSVFLYIKNKNAENQAKKTLLLIFFFVSLAVPFLTLRMYFHYFVQTLLPASIIAGIAIDKIFEGKIIKKERIHIYKKIVTASTLASAIFFLGFYYTFVAIKLANPRFKTSINMFFPNKKLVPAINWLKNNSKKEQTLFVWGDALEIYYFAKRLPAGLSLWLKPFAANYLAGIKNQNHIVEKSSLEGYLKAIVDTLKSDKTSYFIDTQPSGYSGFGDFELSKYKPLYEYVRKHYVKVAFEGKIVIYKRKDASAHNLAHGH